MSQRHRIVWLIVLSVGFTGQTHAAKKALLELNIQPQQAMHLKTRHVTEYITHHSEQDITVRQKQQTEMEYGVECVKHTGEDEMLFNKTLMSLAFVHHEDSGEGDYRIVREYDSKTGERKEDAVANPFIFTLGSRIFVRADCEGKLLGHAGAKEAAALVLEAMYGPQAPKEMAGQLAYYTQTLGRIPAFLAHYPGKMKQNETWQAPYYHSTADDLWSRDWTWRIDEIENDTLKVVGTTGGEEENAQPGDDVLVVQHFKTEITAKLFIDRKTGIILHGDIQEKKSGTIKRRKSAGDEKNSQGQLVATVEVNSAGTIETRLLEDETE